MRKAVSIQLIENEQTEYSNGCRIVPKLLLPKADDEPEFDNAVVEQIEGCEMLTAHGQTLRGIEQIIGNEVARVLRQFRSCNDSRQIKQELCSNDVRKNAGGDFRQRKRAFEHQADLKGEVDPVLVK